MRARARLRALRCSLAERAPPAASPSASGASGTRVLIVNPSGAELRGTLGEGLAASRCECTEVTTVAAAEMLAAPSIHGTTPVSATVDEVLEAYPTPAAALAEWDGLVVLGSPFSVRNWEHPGAEGLGGTVGPAVDIDAMLELIRAFHADGRPVLRSAWARSWSPERSGGARTRCRPTAATPPSRPAAPPPPGGTTAAAPPTSRAKASGAWNLGSSRKASARRLSPIRCWGLLSRPWGPKTGRRGSGGSSSGTRTPSSCRRAQSCADPSPLPHLQARPPRAFATVHGAHSWL